MKWTPGLVAVILASALATAGRPALAEPANRLSSEILCSGLADPAALAVQPGTGHLFLAERGAGRVSRIDPAEPNSRSEVLRGFPAADAKRGDSLRTALAALAFADANTLLVAGEGLGALGPLAVYRLPQAGKAQGESPLEAAEVQQRVGVSIAGVAAAKLGLSALLPVPQGCYAAAHSADGGAWLVRGPLSPAKPSRLTAFVDTQAATGIGGPAAMTINYRGLLVVGHAGRSDTPRDSLLAFYLPKGGQLLMRLETSLYDIVGLAYSRPDASGRLYAVDLAAMATDQGGLYRLDQSLQADGTPGVEAVKLLALERPTALAFAPDGALYVTVGGAGGAERDAGEGATGQLLRLSGAF